MAHRRRHVVEQVLAAQHQHLLAGEAREPPFQLLGVAPARRRRSAGGAIRRRGQPLVLGIEGGLEGQWFEAATARWRW